MKKAFTALEMALVVGIIAILFAISLPVYRSFQNRNDLDLTAQVIAQSLRRAETLAQANDGNSTWGVKINIDIITLFKGSSYAARDATYDETFSLSSSITPSGIDEVVFSKMTGLPQTTGTITLTSNINETRILTLNAKGTITY